MPCRLSGQMREMDTGRGRNDETRVCNPIMQHPTGIPQRSKMDRKVNRAGRVRYQLIDHLLSLVANPPFIWVAFFGFQNCFF